MFIRVNMPFLDDYAETDYLLPFMIKERELHNNEATNSRQYNNMLRHKWKRAMFDKLYCGLKGQKILDVGGAYCGYRPLIEENDYTLLEPQPRFTTKNIRGKVINRVFQKYKTDEVYDYVICCDIYFSDGINFDKLLDKFLPVCKEVRLSLTHIGSNKGRYAFWPIPKINAILKKYGVNGKMFYEEVDYLPNKRNVYLISFKGKLCKNQ